MKHHGNICKINGAEVESVDVIIGGSPCQDLSVAGKRAGLDGERSVLFLEQIRMIKEMRNATRRTDGHARPRWMVWENVPGAFSCDKGEVFRIVLEETAKIADEAAVIPQPPKEKWANAGAVMGNGWSIAWRVFDAQFWGVPQRRRRIALVADFGGQSAPEILFKSDSVSGYFAESGAQGERVAGDAKGGVTTAGGSDVTSTLFAAYGTKWNGNSGALTGDHFVLDDACGNHAVPTTYFLQGNGIDRADTAGCNGCGWRENESYTLNTLVVESLDARGNGDGETVNTITGDHQNRVTDYTGIVTYQKTTGPLMANSHPGSYSGQDAYTDMFVAAVLAEETGPVAFACNQRDEVRDLHDVSAAIQAQPGMKQQTFVAAVDCRNGTENPDINGTLQAKPNGGTSYNLQNTVRTHQSVRRLTPLECERLQGYEDGWTNIPPQTEVTAEDLSFWRTVWDEWQMMNGAKPKTDKQIIKWLQSEPADSARYKALGNSIALPPWRFVLSRIFQQGARTMASLFDGIGGFPKIWNELGGETLWSSEIEPFPIAVTRYRFKEEQP